MKARTILLLILFIGLTTTKTIGQEWTKAQKEVWQVVEDLWAKYKALDAEGYTAILHDKYEGWSNETALPDTKNIVKRWLIERKNDTQGVSYELYPARICITENAAVVDYYYIGESTITREDKKERQEWEGKMAEFYVKEGGKWLLLGDYEQSTKK